MPISAKLVADLLSTAGTDRVLTMDLHAAQIQGFFDIPVDHLFAAPVIIEHVQQLTLEDLIVVSPDAGGVERARAYAKRLDASLAIVDKRRDQPNVAEVHNVIGDVEGRTALIVDDIVDTAGTLTKVAEAIKAAGAREVLASCSHAVLSGHALERIEKSPLSKLIVTDSMPLAPEKLREREDRGAHDRRAAGPRDQEHPRGDLGDQPLRLNVTYPWECEMPEFVVRGGEPDRDRKEREPPAAQPRPDPGRPLRGGQGGGAGGRLAQRDRRPSCSSASGENTLFDLELGGNAAQGDPEGVPARAAASGQLLHADFYEVALDKAMRSRSTSSSRARRSGSSSRAASSTSSPASSRSSACPPTSPTKIAVDITDLELGKHLRVSDLTARRTRSRC